MEARLARANTIVETLHLLPPSPGLLRYWLLEGRARALAGAHEEARDRWESLADLPASDTLPRLRVEAIVRLALLCHAIGATGEAERLEEQLTDHEVVAALPAGWASWTIDLASIAGASGHGGSPLPPPPAQAPVETESTGKSAGASP